MAQSVQNINLAELDQLIDLYQPTDCSGTAIGDPIKAIPVVQVGSNSTSICNPADIYLPLLGELQDIRNKLSDIISNQNEANAAAGIGVDVESVIICVTNSGVGVQWYLRNIIETDPETGDILSSITEYSQDGVSWSETAPAGTITIGECPIVYYIENEHFLVMGGSAPAPYSNATADGVTYTFPAATYHSIDVLVENGDASISINGKKFYHKKGYSISYEADKLLSNVIIVKAESADAVITVSTLK